MAHDYGKLIDSRGSLQLHHFEGDDFEPETFTVSLIENPRVAGSLEVAREWFEVGGMRLNGSQAQTVKAWYDAHL